MEGCELSVGSISMIIATNETSYFKEFISHLSSIQTVGSMAFVEKNKDILYMALELDANIVMVDIGMLGNSFEELLTEFSESNYGGVFIITLENFDTTLSDLASKYNNVFLLVKTENIDDFTRKVLLVFRYGFEASVYNKADSVKQQSTCDFPAVYYRQVTRVLLNCGFNPKHKGFIYTREAVLLNCLTKDPGSLSKDIYPFISEKYNVSIDSVERAIRSAVVYVWDKNMFEPLSVYHIKYRYSQKPTNSMIISNIADILKKDVISYRS